MRTICLFSSLIAIAALASGCAYSTSTRWSGVSSGESMHLADCTVSACDISVKNTGRIPVPITFDSGGVKRWHRILMPDSTFAGVIGRHEILLATNSAEQSAKLKVHVRSPSAR